MDQRAAGFVPAGLCKFKYPESFFYKNLVINYALYLFL